MSYILDALKRAERERKQGQVSVLDEIPAAPGEQPRRRLPRLLIPVVAGVAVLCGLVYALLAWRHHSDTAAAARQPPPVASAPQPALPPPRPRPQSHFMPPQGPTATIEDGNKLATLDDVQAPPAAPPPVAANDQAPQPVPPPVAASAPPPPAPPPAEAAQAADNPPPPPAPPADAEPAPAEAAPAAPADRELKEMPENFRASFPAFTVDVHAYNSDPQRRFVLISGKRYHEGDTLAEGPRIVGIVPEGIVFDWQGQRVLYALSR